MFKEMIPTVWCDYKVIDKVQEDSSGITYKVSKLEGTKQIFRIVRVISIPRTAEEIDLLRNNGKTDLEIKGFYESVARNTVNALSKNISLNSKSNLASVKDVKIIPRADIGFDIFVLEDFLKPLTLHCKTTTLKEKDVAMLGADICSALSECHKNGIFHESISPETIFLSQSKKYKLGNVGVVRREYFSPVSTVFASPEFLAQGICNEKSDIYSLGLVLYTLLGGQLPYSVDTPHEEIVNKKASSKGFILSNCSNAKLSSVILRSIAKDPATRFNSADEFRTALLGAVGATASTKTITGDGIHPIYIDGKAVYKGAGASPKVTAKHDITATKRKTTPDAGVYTPPTQNIDPTADVGIYAPSIENTDAIPPMQEGNNGEEKSPKAGIIIGVVIALAVVVALVIIIFAMNGNDSTEASSEEISISDATDNSEAEQSASSDATSTDSSSSREEASTEISEEASTEISETPSEAPSEESSEEVIEPSSEASSEEVIEPSSEASSEEVIEPSSETSSEESTESTSDAESQETSSSADESL